MKISRQMARTVSHPNLQSLIWRRKFIKWDLFFGAFVHSRDGAFEIVDSGVDGDGAALALGADFLADFVQLVQDFFSAPTGVCLDVGELGFDFVLEVFEFALCDELGVDRRLATELPCHAGNRQEGAEYPEKVFCGAGFGCGSGEEDECG